MKKRLILMVSLCLVLSLCFIPNTFAAKQIVMKIGHAHPINTPRHQAFLKFKELVEKKSKNTVKVEIYPAGQIGSEPEMIEAIKMGTLEGGKAGCYDLVSKKLLIYTMPFLFNKIEDVYKVTKGSFADKIAKDAEKNGVVIITNGDGGGFRNISNNKRPVVKPEDMKGLKMRTPPIESIIKIMETLGANPVSIPYGDTYMALKTGVADGQENPFVNMAAMKFYEVQKYLTVCQYQFHPDPFYVSKKWWDTLDKKTQKLITTCAWQSQDLSNKLMRKADEDSYNLIKKSMEVTVLSKAQKAAFVKKTKAVDDYFVKKGYFTQQEITELRNLIK
jgi:tripartite ATP-independent transporter DctP family solute receptor